ncbi:MAG: hypothetical protein GTO18_01310 [Anaerolineales bacterium]|nr:hypothetical protein [Anaerolineales bacterium]
MDKYLPVKTQFSYFLPLFPLIVIVSMAIACGAVVDETPPPLPTSLPTETPIDTATPTFTPAPTMTPTNTPEPTPTPFPGLWLDTQVFELTLEYPPPTPGPGWIVGGEIVIPIDAEVGGVVFVVDEYQGIWGSLTSRSVGAKESVMTDITIRDYGSGDFCVSDFFGGYEPERICEIVFPGSTTYRWITPYFAGHKTQVGVAFSTGGCDPNTCTTFLKISGIRLILYNSAELPPG